MDVGVVTWNTKDLTVKALRHLLDTDQGVDIRLLVWDNASSDGTADALAESVAEAEVLRSDVNLGFGAGVNQLLARSDAEFFLTLNSDAWPDPGALGRLVASALRSPNAAAVAPRLERPDGQLEHSTYPFPSVGVAAVTALGMYRRFGRRWADRKMLEGAWAHDRPREVDWAVGAALLMRRSAVGRIGGFDESYFMYAEDLEWCWRARTRGWTIQFEPEAIVRHVGNASGSQGYGRRRTAAYLQNTYRFYRRYHGRLDTLGFRALSLAGCSRLYLGSRIRGDADQAAFWADHVRAHLRPVSNGEVPAPAAQRRP